jgi:hypothetical protein
MLRRMMPRALRANLGLGRKTLFGAPVGDQLDAGKQTDAADLADHRMIGERAAQCSQHLHTQRPGTTGDIDLVVDAQRFGGDGRGDGMARIGEAVPEDAVPVPFVGDRLVERI